jgi:protein-S-isoprenylcysteine O-methyltransferase Ste14
MTEERGANVRVPPPLVFLVFLIIGIGLSYVWPLQTHLAVSARLTIAIASGAAALAVIISCVSLFRKSGQNPRPWTPTPSLVIEGPYRLSRNPIYVSMAPFQAAIGLAGDNMWIVLLAIPALAVVHFSAVLPEEKYLSEKFGDEYRQYMQSVRRYL